MIQFSNEQGDTWVDNFQGGDGYSGDLEPDIEPWPEASIIVVIVSGACYLVSTVQIGEYVCRQSTATGLLFNEERTKLFVADCSNIFSYGRSGDVVWRRKGLAADGVVLWRCTSGIVEGEACHSPPDEWFEFRILEVDGADA